MNPVELDSGSTLPIVYSDLPEGWALGRVGDLFDLVNGYPFNPSQWKQQGRPIIRIQNLNNSHAAFNRCPDHLPNKYLVQSGALLFAWSGTPGTSFGAHIWSGETGWLNQHIFRVDFDDCQLDKQFLRLAINVNLQDYIEQAQGGVGLAHITKAKFDSSSLIVAPLAEQRRIVAKVEESLAHVNSAKTHLTKVPDVLKRFRRAVLAAACSGKLTEDWREHNPSLPSTAADLVASITPGVSSVCIPDEEDPMELFEIPSEWAWVRCEHLCNSERAITYGVIKLGPPVEHGTPTLRSSDVRWLRIDEENVKSISKQIASGYERTFLQGGEILVTVRGTLGGVAVVPYHLAGCNISREVAVLPIHRSLSADFVGYAVAANWSQKWLTRVSKGVAYTGVNIRDLKRLPVPVPPLAEQQEIVRRVKTLLALADGIEQRAATAITKVGRLNHSILAKAFSGELVPTEAELARREGRDYEPASVLLERIRAERANQAKTPAVPKRKLRKAIAHV
jgi:type I restriction enzyme, S subunit